MEYSKELQNDIDFLKEINSSYNNLLTEIVTLKENLEIARINKEKILSHNTLNYRLKCGIVLFLDIFININGLESFIFLPLIFIFAIDLFKKQKKVRDNIRKLEDEIKYKESFKTELYDVLCDVRSLVNERKKEEENANLYDKEQYSIIENYEIQSSPSENFDNSLNNNYDLIERPIRKVLRLE